MIFQSPNEFFDFFFPRFCCGCGIKLQSAENYVCQKCSDGLIKVDSSLLNIEFQRKFSNSGIISEFFCLYLFDESSPLRHIIHNLKYNGKFRVGLYFGSKLGLELKKRYNIPPDYIIPVPLHPVKQAERGYNQSYYLAKGVSEKLGVKISTKGIIRSRFTVSQTGLNIQERKQNVNGAFRVRKPELYYGKKILLIDDVITTGATTLACAEALKSAGASEIMLCSLALAE